VSEVQVATIQVLVTDGKPTQASLYVDGRFVQGEGDTGGAPAVSLVTPLVEALEDRFPMAQPSRVVPPPDSGGP
jgi:hypothetical protein